MDSVQAGAPVGSGPKFGTFATNTGVNHSAAVAEYVTTLSDGNNVLQAVQLTSGLPVQPQTGSTWSVTQGGSWTVQPGNTPNTVAWLVSDRPAATGGLTPATHTSTGTSADSTNVKNAAGQIFGLFASNTNASPRWLKIYDKATAPTVGTDTVKLKLLIPGNTAGGGISIQQPKGIAFASGIGFGITTGEADNDTGAVAAGDVVVNVLYA